MEVVLKLGHNILFECTKENYKRVIGKRGYFHDEMAVA